MAQPSTGVTYLSVAASKIIELGQLLDRIDHEPTNREEETLRVSTELLGLVEDLRDRAIAANLSKRKLTIRQIARIAGMTPAGIHKRGRHEGIDMSKPALDAMQWRRPA